MNKVLAMPAKNCTLDEGTERRTTDQIAKVESVLIELLSSIKPIIDSTHDEAFAELVLTSDEYIEPLSKNEMLVLGSGLYMSALRAKEQFDPANVFGYGDVITLTHRFSNRPLGTSSIHGAISQLIDKGLVRSVSYERRDSIGRPSIFYEVTEQGRNAFRLSILSAREIKEGRCKSAA